MEIKFTLDETEHASQIEVLKRNLGIEQDDLHDALSRIALTSFMEYFKMLSGETMPSKADEVRQLRLFLLSQYYKSGDLPSIQEIVAMFHITNMQANTLLSNVISRYHLEIRENLKKSIRNILSAASTNDRRIIMICTSPVIMSHMNSELCIHAPEYKKVKRVNGSVGEIDCTSDTYDKLVELFTPVEV